MATSGTTSWSLNRDQVITTALRKLGVMASGGTPTTNQISEASDSLNALVKVFQADGMPVWKVNQQSFTTVSGTSNYSVGIGQTINIPKPLKVTQAKCQPSTGSDFPLNIYTRYDYINLPQNSSNSGTPVNFYYQPLRTTGNIILWPIPADSVTTIIFQYVSPYEDMSASANDFDFPSEWMMPLIYGLANVLAPEYGMPILDRQQLAKEAEFWHQYVLSMGTEEGSVYIQPSSGQ